MSIRHGWSWWRAAVSSRCERRSRAGAWSRRQPCPAPAPPARPRATATPPACSPAPLLVHPHIIHPHRLREDGRRIRTARPVPTHGYIENDEKRVVVHPPPRQVPRSDGLVQRVVDVPANRGRLPLDGVHVEGVGERARGQVIRAADAARTGVPGAVHRTVYAAGFLADVLHDVDLAARGPPGRGGGEGRTRCDGEPKQDAGHGDCFRYLQATMPAPLFLISKA